MALNLQQIRDYVRAHLDIEVDDLPDSVLDLFIRDASHRIEHADSRWPFYEATWNLVTTQGTRNYGLSLATPIPPSIDQLTNVQGPRWNLAWVGQEMYDVLNPPDSDVQGEPTHFTLWADELWLNPTPNAAYTLVLRGYRQPTDWVTAGAGTEPDMPEELHQLVATWALSRAYAQQDDPELASLFEQEFVGELELFRRRIVETPHFQPIVLNGRRSRRSGPFSRMLFDFEV